MMTRSRIGVGLVAVGMVAGLSQGIAVAADAKVTGTWTYTMKRNDQEIKNTLKLKVEGEKVTGTVENPRGEVAIADGKLDKDGTVTFKVTREFNGNTFSSSYTGKVEGDTLKLKVETERNGEKQVRDIEAKREGDKA